MYVQIVYIAGFGFALDGMLNVHASQVKYWKAMVTLQKCMYIVYHTHLWEGLVLHVCVCDGLLSSVDSGCCCPKEIHRKAKLGGSDKDPTKAQILSMTRHFSL